MIGLGAGTFHNGMMRHSVETHIVELDPMVYQYAKNYFGLLPNYTAHIMDAVEFIKNVMVAPGLEQYGARNGQLLKDDGVVAINYAGDLKQRAARIVIQTIHSVFDPSKVFGEDEPLDGDKAVDFTNMALQVIFCTKSTQDFRFRHLLERDYLHSLSCQKFLHPKFEVTLDTLFGCDGEPVKHAVLDDQTMQEFKQRQKRDAVHH